ncbi:MAG TPA: hypothetical protein VN943_11695 [Candidatus Acidoferrum sp.]|nr:hypothetical protein [Candidatus Acidoferrum sp.]
MSVRPEILTSFCMLLCSAFWLSWLAAGSPQNAKFSSGRNQAQAQSQAQGHGKAEANKALDACSLLTSSDISAVLGEPLQELKPSVQATGNMNMSQCLFVTRNFAKSVSLAVATPGSGDSGARGLRAFWRNQFHSPHKQEEERQPAPRKSPKQSAFSSSRETLQSESASDGEAEDDARKPRPISALGEEAYWVGSPLASALYVLQGGLFLRISVGGIPKESIRIAKSKSLASAVLPRLHHHHL